MKRIGIFSFYDKEEIVDSYIEYLLCQLKTVVDRLIIVVNGKVNKKGYELFSKYVKEIIIRDNKGFDAGAYADIILNYLGKDELGKWEELVLCNNTFYGPFIPMTEIFRNMLSKKVDFWGLNIVDRGILNHIQSYFLVFNHNILKDSRFIMYFYNEINIKEDNIKAVYGTFEVGLFVYLKNCGYKFGTYSNTQLHDIYRNPVISIEKYHLPILKKKCFSVDYNEQLMRLYILKYIMQNTQYNIDFIIQNAKREYMLNETVETIIKFNEKDIKEKYIKLPKSTIDEKNLLKWMKKDDFYVYGAGAKAGEFFSVYLKTEKNFKGFIISDNQKRLEKELFKYPIFYKSEITQNFRCIVIMDIKYIFEVKECLENNSEVLYLWEEVKY